MDVSLQRLFWRRFLVGYGRDPRFAASPVAAGDWEHANRVFHEAGEALGVFTSGNVAIMRALDWVALAACMASSVEAQTVGARRRSSNEVLLVCNGDSPISRAVADDYASKRHVRNRLVIHCQDSAIKTENETLDLATYTAQIEKPVRSYLAGHPEINFIVLTKGVPIRIVGAPLGSCWENSKEPEATRGHPSVDSYLSALDYTSKAGARKISIAGSGAIGAAYSNRYWNANEPFTHAKFGGYLVTRLDGYTEADAKALVSEALDAEAHASEIARRGEFLLDVQPIFGLGDKATQPGPITVDVIPRESDYSEFNADMLHAYDDLTARKLPVELEKSESFVGGRSNLLGYFSWGSNDPKYSPDAYLSLKFAPGSLSDTAVSTSARTFLPTQGGQSLLVDLVAHGLTCGKGYSDEPLLQAIASPTIALNRYTAGYTMAESFYAASHFVAWEDIVVGDPLCAPYYPWNRKK
jgi:uncharacterized protein (TIGR03790 family)